MLNSSTGYCTGDQCTLPNCAFCQFKDSAKTTQTCTLCNYSTSTLVKNADIEICSAIPTNCTIAISLT